MEFDLATLLTPQKTKFTLIRFGRNTDGGYVVPVELCKICDLTTFGVADDVSFEVDYRNVNPNANITCFDGSIDDIPEEGKEIGINFVKKLVSVEEVDIYADINNIYMDNYTIIKMDIEGSEFKCLNSLCDYKFVMIPVLIVEFHVSEIARDRNINDFILLLNRIEHYMHPIHVHFNNTWGTFMQNGNMFGRSIEVTFLNNIYKDSKYPIEGLDYPCNPYYNIEYGLNWIENEENIPEMEQKNNRGE